MTTKEYFTIYLDRRVDPVTTIKYKGYLKEISKHLSKENEDFVYGKSSSNLYKLRIAENRRAWSLQ